MEILAILFGMLSLFAFTNLIYSCFFLITKQAVGIYKWITMEMDFLEVAAYLFVGPTYSFAQRTYKKCNWFWARVTMIGWLILMAILVIAFFSLFAALT
ncbi:MAG: hypothetical protein ACI4XL_13135 [Bacillus sp. (in: firmicutes)]